MVRTCGFFTYLKCNRPYPLTPLFRLLIALKLLVCDPGIVTDSGCSVISLEPIWSVINYGRSEECVVEMHIYFCCLADCLANVHKSGCCEGGDGVSGCVLMDTVLRKYCPICCVIYIYIHIIYKCIFRYSHSALDIY